MATTLSKSLDESHGVMHSFNTLHYAQNIFENEKLAHSELIPHERIIYVASALHDMCDKKYMNESEGIVSINDMLKEHISQKEIEAVHDIIGTMSYSKVKKQGFPDLGKYQSAYHVVREADLLCAYDFDRALIYHMYRKNNDFQEAYQESIQLFKNRVFKHEKDNLFTYDYSKQQAAELKKHSLRRIRQWKRIMKSL
tara:strand:+ start:2463 stop:3053 length:591 start_codon:yes stop_codon:yes gene_type:complete